METITKALTIITNAFTILGKKIDGLGSEIKRQKPPIVNVKPPEVTVNVPDVIVPEIKIPEINVPEIKIPDIIVPEIKVPKIVVPEIKLPTINIPKQDAPIVNVPPAQITVEPTPVTFPKEIKVIGMEKLIAEVSREPEEINLLKGISSKNPIPMMVVDSKGRQINDFGGEFSAPSMVAVRVGTTAVSDSNPLPVTVDGFAIPVFDTQIIDESLAPGTTTITYKKNGVTVATKTITVVGTTTTITVS